MKDFLLFIVGAALLLGLPATIVYVGFAYFTFDLHWFVHEDLRIGAAIIYGLVELPLLCGAASA